MLTNNIGRKANHRKRSCSVIPAMSLLETLIALSLCCAIAAAGMIIVVQTMLVRKTAIATVRERWERTRTFDQFEEDVESAIANVPGGLHAISAPAADGGLIEILGTAWTPNSEAAWGARFPARIVYSLERSPDIVSNGRIVRSVVFLTDPEQFVHKNVLTERILEAIVHKNVKSLPSQLSTHEEQINSIMSWVLECRWEGDGSNTMERRSVKVRSADLGSTSGVWRGHKRDSVR